MVETARSILRYRSLLWALTTRELKARYRGSMLGFFWSLVNPILLLAVYSFVFGFIFQGGRLGEGERVEPYALFLVCGLFPWLWASSSLLEGTMSLIANAGLIRKATFPVELPPVVSVLANGAHFLLALPILAAALIGGRLLGYEVGGWAALLLPVIILLQLPFLVGLSLGLAALNVHFKDTRDLIGNLITLAFFLTPILYPLSILPGPWLRRLVLVNPFSPFTMAYQDALFFNRLPGLEIWVQMVVITFLGWWIGTFFFSRLRETLGEAV